MNDATLQALTALAQKLNTTTEQLWAVMLAQAPIYAWTQIAMLVVYFGALSAAFVWGARYAKAKTQRQEENKGEYRKNDWWLDTPVPMFAMVIAFMLIIYGGAWLASTMPSIIAALVNPQYWVLQQLLSALK